MRGRNVPGGVLFRRTQIDHERTAVGGPSISAASSRGVISSWGLRTLHNGKSYHCGRAFVAKSCAHATVSCHTPSISTSLAFLTQLDEMREHALGRRDFQMRRADST